MVAVLPEMAGVRYNCLFSWRRTGSTGHNLGPEGAIIVKVSPKNPLPMASPTSYRLHCIQSQRHLLGSQCSHTWACGGHFTFRPYCWLYLILFKLLKRKNLKRRIEDLVLLAKSTFCSVKAGFPPKLCYLHETTQLVNISLVSALSEVSGSTSLGKNKESFNIKLKLAPSSFYVRGIACKRYGKG